MMKQTEKSGFFDDSQGGNDRHVDRTRKEGHNFWPSSRGKMTWKRASKTRRAQNDRGRGGGTPQAISIDNRREHTGSALGCTYAVILARKMYEPCSRRKPESTRTGGWRIFRTKKE